MCVPVMLVQNIFFGGNMPVSCQSLHIILFYRFHDVMFHYCLFLKSMTLYQNHVWVDMKCLKMYYGIYDKSSIFPIWSYMLSKLLCCLSYLLAYNIAFKLCFKNLPKPFSIIFFSNRRYVYTSFSQW